MTVSSRQDNLPLTRGATRTVLVPATAAREPFGVKEAMLATWTNRAISTLAVAFITAGVALLTTECFGGGADAALKVAKPWLPALAAWFLSNFLRLTGIGALITLLAIVWDKPHALQQACTLPAAGCGLLQAYGWWGTPWTTIKGTQLFGVDVTPDTVQWSSSTFFGYLVLAAVSAGIFLATIEAKKNSGTAS